MVKMVVVKLVWEWDSNHTNPAERLDDGFACFPERRGRLIATTLTDPGVWKALGLSRSYVPLFYSGIQALGHCGVVVLTENNFHCTCGKRATSPGMLPRVESSGYIPKEGGDPLV